MNLTDRQRIYVFVGLVVVLAFVGVYLTWPKDNSEKNEPSANATSQSPTQSQASPAPVTAPSGFDIYPLLPYSQKDFATAAELVRKFTADYGTYRHDEDPKAYVDRLQNLITPQLRSELARAAATPAQIDERKKNQESSTGEAKVESIRTIEKSSLIFVATGKQKLISAGKSSEKSEQYAVTVEKAGTGWTVQSIQPADVGNVGDSG